MQKYNSAQSREYDQGVVECQKASVDATRADVVVAEINSQMLRCSEDRLLHISHVDKVVYVDRSFRQASV